MYRTLYLCLIYVFVCTQQRHRNLEEAIRFFNLMRDCDEMESWIIQKEAIVKTEEKGANKDHVESMQKKFEVSTPTNVTELLTSSIQCFNFKGFCN